jgi:hypothetical protein
MNTQTNDAQQYAEQIAEELRQLDEALSGPDSPALAELFGEIDEEEIISEMGVLSEYLNRYALDLSVRRDTRGADYGTTIEVTRTIGGPGCWIRRDTADGDTVAVLAVWGWDRATVLLSLGNVAAWLDELAASF